MRRNGWARWAALLVFWCFCSAMGQASAAATLMDRNSRLEIDLVHKPDKPTTGMDTWSVDGSDHVYQQWFWYRVGSTGPEYGIETLGLTSSSVANLDSDDGNEHLMALYGDPNALTVELGYTLIGGAPGSDRSHIAETITLANHGTAAVNLHFFQYCDLDLGGLLSTKDGSAEIVDGHKARQVDCYWQYLVSETVVSPRPTHYEVAYLDEPNDPNHLLTNGDPNDLTDNAGPILGPADLTWAFQWDATLPSGGSLTIDKDKAIVPEPLTGCLLGLGGLGLIRRHRMR